MSTTRRASARKSLPRSASAESELSTITADAATSSSSNALSTSTPPTSLADSASVQSVSLKNDAIASQPAEPSSATPAKASEEVAVGRPKRSRSSVGTYNLKELSGTAVHAPRKFRKSTSGNHELASEEQATTVARRSTISAGTSLGTADINDHTASTSKEPEPQHDDRTEALDAQLPPKNKARGKSTTAPRADDDQTPQNRNAKTEEPERRKSSRLSGVMPGPLTQNPTVLGKRGRQSQPKTMTMRELKNLADTPEYAKIEKQPVVTEIWSNGKLVKPDEPPPSRKRARFDEASTNAKLDKANGQQSGNSADLEPEPPKKARNKVWLTKGLYAGQSRNLDWFNMYTEEEKKTAQSHLPVYKPDGFLPLPMWHGQRLLHMGRDFRLPFDVCAPLPPGQPKPDEWRKTTKNRFIGNASAYWKRSTLFDDFSSRCICGPRGTCGEDCQNRIMLYECDDGNCSAGRERCTNRAFADLQERRQAGGPYRIGVEVVKTADRGYGVRSNRGFEPNQIIVEYTGEIITEQECERRMNEDYKNNECYYLMSFDQNMIIDATRGSMARFVNHSCEPNCRMVKWIVGGQPRMALFAGDQPIMPGEELTYDYNFDPFSAKNVQECRCGSKNCRGVLGPRPKGVVTKVSEKMGAAGGVVMGAVKGVGKGAMKAKRKVAELLGVETDSQAVSQPAKKRKIATPSPKKKVTSSKASVRSSAVASKTGTKRGSKVTAASLQVPVPKKKAFTLTTRTVKSAIAAKVQGKGSKTPAPLATTTRSPGKAVTSSSKTARKITFTTKAKALKTPASKASTHVSVSPSETVGSSSTHPNRGGSRKKSSADEKEDPATPSPRKSKKPVKVVLKHKEKSASALSSA